MQQRFFCYHKDKYLVKYIIIIIVMAAENGPSYNFFYSTSVWKRYKIFFILFSTAFVSIFWFLREDGARHSLRILLATITCCHWHKRISRQNNKKNINECWQYVWGD